MSFVVLGGLRRANTLIAGQAKNAVSFTGGAISGVTITGATTSGNIVSGLIKALPNDFSVTSSTTLVDVTGFSTSVAVGTYKLNMVLGGTSAASGGWKVSPAFSGTATFRTAATIYTASSNLGADVGSVIDRNSAVTGGFLEGTLVVTVAGTLKIQFAQSTSNGTASTLSAGSYFELIRIA